MTVAITIENVSKLYRLGEVGTGTLAHDLNRLWHRIRGKEDPYAKVASANDRTRVADTDYIWALRNVNFQVEQGQVLGIIGRNGAGKSTLLKLLSRVIAPTTGNIKIRGRIASLLEVGTGFHPELTGRDNIFLNGTILGMCRLEIQQQLDAIVDFSGCARYLDTPVKRYSSGMMVRLGFAVAAHLRCEVLIVDEVLAVGDAEFQNKCIGKMRDVSTNSGRTILFVSHNMAAIRSLCQTGMLMNQGTMELAGPIQKVLDRYREFAAAPTTEKVWPHADAPCDDLFRLLRVKASNSDASKPYLLIEDEIIIEVQYQILRHHPHIAISVHLNTQETCAFVGGNQAMPHEPGVYSTYCAIPRHLLNSVNYTVSVFLITNATEFRIVEENVISMVVNESAERVNYVGTIIGTVRPTLRWHTAFAPISTSTIQ